MIKKENVIFKFVNVHSKFADLITLQRIVHINGVENCATAYINKHHPIFHLINAFSIDHIAGIFCQRNVKGNDFRFFIKNLQLDLLSTEGFALFGKVFNVSYQDPAFKTPQNLNHGLSRLPKSHHSNSLISDGGAHELIERKVVIQHLLVSWKDISA